MYIRLHEGGKGVNEPFFLLLRKTQLSFHDVVSFAALKWEKRRRRKRAGERRRRRRRRTLMNGRERKNENEPKEKGKEKEEEELGSNGNGNNIRDVHNACNNK